VAGRPAHLLILFSFAGAAEARKIQVAVPGFSQNMAFSAAKLAGYYQAEELDVEFVLMSAGTAVQALIGGSVADGQDGHHDGLED